MNHSTDILKSVENFYIQCIRRTGAASLDLCYVACGRFDGYFEYRLSPWDFAAGMLIVTEAKGGCAWTPTGWNGGSARRGLSAVTG